MVSVPFLTGGDGQKPRGREELGGLRERFRERYIFLPTEDRECKESGRLSPPGPGGFSGRVEDVLVARLKEALVFPEVVPAAQPAPPAGVAGAIVVPPGFAAAPVGQVAPDHGGEGAIGHFGRGGFPLLRFPCRMHEGISCKPFLRGFFVECSMLLLLLSPPGTPVSPPLYPLSIWVPLLRLPHECIWEPYLGQCFMFLILLPLPNTSFRCPF